MGFTCAGWPVRPALTQRPSSLGLAASLSSNKHGTLAQNPPSSTPRPSASAPSAAAADASPLQVPSLAVFPLRRRSPHRSAGGLGRSFLMGDEPMRARILLREGLGFWIDWLAVGKTGCT
jgi:hypothetical protein